MYLHVTIECCKCNFCGFLIYPPAPERWVTVTAEQLGWDWITPPAKSTVHACKNCLTKAGVKRRFAEIRAKLRKAKA